MNEALVVVFVLLFGTVIGSFLNVCIYRIPLKETVVTTPSHCMYCGKQLKWYHLIPLLSYIAQGGKCGFCRAKLSVQYPLVEVLNGAAYFWIYSIYGMSVTSLLFAFCISALIVISVIDWRTKEIPYGLNVFIFGLGCIQVMTDFGNWHLYVIGFFAVSVLLYILAVTTGGMGGGDVKLMAAAGLLLGWQRITLALVIGCTAGSIIHLILMRLGKADRVLAFGPYLSLGIASAMLYGRHILDWYTDVLLHR